MSEAVEDDPAPDEAVDDAADRADDADEVVVRVTVGQLSLTVTQPPEVVEAVVRDELQRRRQSARIQTFVPILAERAARRRLRG